MLFAAGRIRGDEGQARGGPLKAVERPPAATARPRRILAGRLRPTLVGALACVCLLSAPRPSQAGNAVMTFTAPKRAGNANVFITDLQGGTINVNVAIAAGWTATQKRNAIIAALNAAAPGTAYTFANNGAAGITITNNGGPSITANFNPRGTGEARDVLVIPGTTPTTFPKGHGTIDPHSPSMSLIDNGTPNTFTAGVMVNDAEYSVTLSGNDLVFGGASTITGANLATILYNQLTSLSIPGVTLSLVSGDTNGYAGDLAIDALFDYGTSDDGIVWGMTADPGSAVVDAGFIGQMSGSAVPEPSTLIMFSLGLFGAAAIARWRAAHRGRTVAVSPSICPA
jgi:hypothetical protein